ncbi:MAG: hypothetical protein JW839_22785 [Candidatus Lokiarchaeota archaeon]|nr:hypothetical protein [Candidatus Lokiarchaeota archaeon]
MDQKYRYTRSYRTFKTSLICVIMAVVIYAFIEGLWGGLGYFLGVSTLYYMALFGNIPLAILAGLAVSFSVVSYVKFKKKVADGSIDAELSTPVHVPSVFSGLGSAFQMLGAGAGMGRQLAPEEQKIKGLLQMYPKMTLSALAAKSGVPEGQIEDKLLKLLSEGVIRGHVDPGTGEFISGMVDTTRVRPVDDAVFDCPHCGAIMKSAPVKGTSVRCESCGNLIVVE